MNIFLIGADIVPPFYNYKIKDFLFSDGMGNAIVLVIVAIFISLLCLVFALTFGYKNKDAINVFFTSLMIKTIEFCSIHCIFRYIRQLTKTGIYPEYEIRTKNTMIYLILFFSIIFIGTLLEGLIYGKIIKSKKHNGIILSFQFNVVSLITSILWLFFVFHIHFSMWQS